MAHGSYLVTCHLHFCPGPKRKIGMIAASHVARPCHWKSKLRKPPSTPAPLIGKGGDCASLCGCRSFGWTAPGWTTGMQRCPDVGTPVLQARPSQPGTGTSLSLLMFWPLQWLHSLKMKSMTCLRSVCRASSADVLLQECILTFGASTNYCPRSRVSRGSLNLQFSPMSLGELAACSS
jgi:hypothetical protein